MNYYIVISQSSIKNMLFQI